MDTKFDVLKMKAHLKNAVGCIPFLPWRLEVKIKSIFELVDYALALPPFFAKQFTLSQPMRLGHQFQNAGWRLKVEIKRIYEIADHALAPPQFFCQTVSSISTKGAWTPNLMF